MSSESFEHILKAAQVAGSLTPAWKRFIKTKFFVAILRSPDDDTKNFLLCISRRPVDAKPVVIISEVRDRLDQHLGDGVVAIFGAEIVRRLGDQGVILVELSDGAFNVSRKRVAWLRSGIETTEARVATRKRLHSARPAAPLPVLPVQTALLPGSATPPARPAAAAAPVRRSLEALAALHLPKPAKTGLEFFEPSASNHAAPSAPGQIQMARVKARLTSVPVMLAIAVLAIGLAIFFLVGDSEHTPQGPTPASGQASQTSAPPAPAAMPVAAGPAPQAGMLFTPADSSFTVMVPGMPEELELTPDQVEQMGELRMHQYKLVTKGYIYTMQATDYGARVPQDLSAAMAGMQASIVGKDGTLISATTVALRGATGREVRVQLANGAIRAARFAFVGSKFCTVVVEAADGQRSAAEMNAYLNSFQLN